MFYFQPVLLRVAQGCNLRSGVHLEIATKDVPQSERSSVVWGWCQCTQGCGMFSGTAEKNNAPAMPVSRICLRKAKSRHSQRIAWGQAGMAACLCAAASKQAKRVWVRGQDVPSCWIGCHGVVQKTRWQSSVLVRVGWRWRRLDRGSIALRSSSHPSPIRTVGPRETKFYRRASFACAG